MLCSAEGTALCLMAEGAFRMEEGKIETGNENGK